MAKKEIKTDKDGSEIIDLRDKVTVIATDKAPHHDKGAELLVHPKIAESFIEKGFATAKSNGKTVTPKAEEKV